MFFCLVGLFVDDVVGGVVFGGVGGVFYYVELFNDF